jgi:ribosomal protein L37AE/L43A
MVKRRVVKKTEDYIMEEIKICPFCKEHDIIISNGMYHCPSCGRGFTDDDAEHELIRQKISCVCSGEEATEDNPIIIENGTIFQDEEGIVWINANGDAEPTEIDMLTTSELQDIINWLEENYGNVVGTEYFWVYYKN